MQDSTLKQFARDAIAKGKAPEWIIACLDDGFPEDIPAPDIATALGECSWELMWYNFPHFNMTFRALIKPDFIRDKGHNPRVVVHDHEEYVVTESTNNLSDLWKRMKFIQERRQLARNQPQKPTPNLDALYPLRCKVSDTTPSSGFLSMKKMGEDDASRVDVLIESLRRLLERRPLEDGITHDAEIAFRFLLETEGGADTVSRAILGDSLTSLRSACLDIVGRLDSPVSESWRRKIVEESLKSEFPLIRESAIQAVENWEDQTLIKCLENHLPCEENISLHSYTEGVIEDLQDIQQNNHHRR